MFPTSILPACLLQHGICEHLACINGSSTKRLASLNPVWKLVEVVVHDTLYRHASQSNLRLQNGKRKSVVLLDQLLNDFNIRLCNCLTQVPYVSATIIINIPSPLKNFKQSLYYFIPLWFFSDIKFPLKTVFCFNNIVVQIVKLQDKKYLLF